MVFDGAPMPSKADTNQDRRQTRKDARDKALALEEAGNRIEAEKYFSKSISVTPDMAFELIQELKLHHIECITAPYEADAQLAYLCKIGYVSAVISEDSDLLVFGCPIVLYKFDANGGSLQEMSLKSLETHPAYNMKNWTQDQFMMMCILAGCDYLKSFKNIGIKTAYKIIAQTSDLNHIMQKLKIDPANSQEYKTQFFKAVYAFKYHYVYCPIKQTMIQLNEMNPELIISQVGDVDFLGKLLEPEIAYAVAYSEVHPLTKAPFRGNLKRKHDDVFPNFSTNDKKIKPNIYQQIRSAKPQTSVFDDPNEVPTPSFPTQLRPIQLKPLQRKPQIILKPKKQNFDLQAEMEDIKNLYCNISSQKSDDSHQQESPSRPNLLPFASTTEEKNDSQNSTAVSLPFLAKKDDLETITQVEKLKSQDFLGFKQTNLQRFMRKGLHRPMQ